MKLLPELGKIKLRLKLIILFVNLSLIPLLVVMLLTIRYLQEVERQNAFSLNRQIAQGASEEISAFIKSRFGILENINTIYPEFSSAPKLQETILERILYRGGNLIDLVLTDSTGREVIHKNTTRVIAAEDLIDRSKSREFLAVKEQGYYLGPVTTIPEGHPFFLIGRSIISIDGSFQGVIFAQVDARVMQDVVKKISAVGKEGRAYIVDRNGIVIGHPDLSLVLVQKDFSKIGLVKVVITEIDKQGRSDQYQNELGQEVLGAGLPIVVTFTNQQVLETNWFVIAEQPASVALATVRQITWFSLITLAAVLIVVVLATLLFTNRIVGPIEQVHFASKQLGQGNLDYRVVVHTGDEIEDLANEFNDMAKKLQNNITQLTYQNRLFTALRKLDLAALSTIEIQPLCQSIVDVVRAEFGYATSIISLVDYDSQVIKRVAISHYPELDEQLKKLPIPFHQQQLPLTLKDNFLVKAVEEKRSLYTTRIYDLQRGIFPPSISDQLQAALGYKGIFIYPLITKDKVLGVLYYISIIEREKIPENEFAILGEFVAEVSRALENAMLYQNLKKDREIIATERNKLEVALSAISDAVVAVDLFRNIVIFNSVAEKLTGFTKQEILHKPIDQVIHIFDESGELTPLKYCPIRVDGQEGIVFSQQNLKVVGRKEIYVNLMSGQIKEGQSANLGCILTLHDLTQERELEKMKLDFVSMAAHELRTPLTALRGYLSVFIEENKGNLSSEQNMFLNRMNIATSQLISLVENLLSVSRIERGAFAITQTPTEWVANTKALVNDFRERAKEKNLKLSFVEPSKHIPMVLTDRLRVNEVLNNLLVNALTYTQPGGEIKVWVEARDNQVITHVADTGQGIPKEALPHLFTKFFRVSGRLEQGSKGTGLGLYIAKSIVDLHHGKIWVNSQVGRGSIFSFSLPAQQDG